MEIRRKIVERKISPQEWRILEQEVLNGMSSISSDLSYLNGITSFIDIKFVSEPMNTLELHTAQDEEQHIEFQAFRKGKEENCRMYQVCVVNPEAWLEEHQFELEGMNDEQVKQYIEYKQKWDQWLVSTADMSEMPQLPAFYKDFIAQEDDECVDLYPTENDVSDNERLMWD